MARGIFRLELDGKRRLGFDTGLNAQAFAQAKLAQFITQEGRIVLPDGKVNTWLPGGVIESEGTMVVWGPDFEGERFDLLLAPGREDLALEALRYWLAAFPLADEAGLWPAGLFVALGEGPYPAGTMFSPPERLRCRCIQAESPDLWLDGGESLVFQDLKGKEAVSFTAGAMLYRIFAHAAGGKNPPVTEPAPEAARGGPRRPVLGPPVLERSGALPFPSRDPEKLHQDMREGVFLPLGLAAPGLDRGIAELADRALAGLKGRQEPRPSPEDFVKALGPPSGSAAPGRGPAAFFHELEAGEREKLREERERYTKKRNLTVGTRRFVIRNTAIITGIAAALAVVILFTSSMVASRRSLPTTAGLDSRQVLETYYGAFGALDHTLMEACVIKKAGKQDINMITSYFVTSRVRQAYEFSTVMIAAQDWFDAGAPPTSAQVLGVTDLNITWLAGDEEGEEQRYRAEYIIWIPGGDGNPGGIAAVLGPAPEPPPLPEPPDSGFLPEIGGTLAPEEFIPPWGYRMIDDLTLIRHKGNWRISQIDRQEM
ncbi:MAG: hypothetical protein LBH70_00040 [Spirochaetaceae bacterium]|jgi:hypothetical protein|nr:hypothetical protein [Spirochaetaceae bacterium]